MFTNLLNGAPFNDGNGQCSGHVRVYAYNDDDSFWQQKGGNIDGEAQGDESGYSVSLSADGSVVAIGATLNDGANKIDSGHVRVYRYNPNKTRAVTEQSASNYGPIGWDRIGDDIDGEAVTDKTGTSVTLSADGSIVAIGATDNNGQAGSDSGHVRVYEYNGSSWEQKGLDIDGEAQGDKSGNSVSLSADGSILAIGAPFNSGNGDKSGHARVYKFTGWGLGT
ncbi:MAG: hypothetical protein ACR2M6_04435 [Vampirovibrionia bacterium]